MKLLKVDSIGARYDGNDEDVVKNISFTLDEGEVLVIFGKSGSGKTTLLKTIAGLIQPQTGQILIEGEVLEGPKDKLVPGHEEIKLVFQDFHLKSKMTVAENIHYTLLAYEEEYRKQRVEELIDLCGLREVAQSFPEHISGGQKQRLALARALANEPKLLLMDEPFSNLDSITKGILFQEIKSIVRKTETSVIFVSHDARDALSFANKILVMESGEMSQFDNPNEIYNRPNSKSVAMLFGDLNKIESEYYRLESTIISDDGQYKGIVSEVMYFGSHQLLLINCDNTIIKAFDFENQYKIGDSIKLKVDRQKALNF